MKRLICAFVIIAVSFAVSVFGYVYVNDTLDEILYVAENSPDEIYDIWLQKKDLMAVFLNNGDVAEIDEEILLLTESQEKEADEIAAVIYSIKQGEQFKFGNIF